MSDLTVIVPMRDEASRLPLHLPALLDWCRQHDAELLVCDDGSRDATLVQARSLAWRHVARIRLLPLPRRGKGSAVRTGLLQATGRICLMVDADLPLPVEDLDRLVASVAGGADLAIGRRLHPQCGQPWIRRQLSRVSRSLARRLLGVADSQCGAKAWSREAARHLAAQQILDGFAFDVEHLRRARLLSLRVEEVPVRWTHREGSHLHPLRDGLRFAFDLLRLAWAERREHRPDASVRPRPALDATPRALP